MFSVYQVFLSVHCSLVVTCWERADLLANSYATFYCILSLSQVVSWVGVVLVYSIPGFCLLSYFDAVHYISGSAQSDKSLCYVLNE